ncbi:MAG: sigma-70 family RNA polymerase sigma factor [Nannocystaceae bacterium]|nr:sigma-70 family RNA polymerase sigma factor [Nannocystaceae bacterium]
MRASAQPSPANASPRVQVLPFAGDDAELLALLRRGGAAAAALLHDRFAGDVHRVVARCLGPDADRDDVVHDAFVQILRGVGRVREAAGLRGWVVAVAANTARSELRRRRFRRLFWSADPAPEPGVGDGDPEARDLLRRIYDHLDRMPTDERIAFVLRHIERHELTEVAKIVGCSLATAKRRIARASARFAALATSDPELARRFGGGAS